MEPASSKRPWEMEPGSSKRPQEAEPASSKRLQEAEPGTKTENISIKRGLSGAVLKNIALITMLIDHVGAFFLYTYTSLGDGTEVFAGADNMYVCMRAVGRCAFPLFCFLLTEGFCHTHNLCRYMGRMALFALLSEIPFDLARTGKIYDPGGQNVFFTLTLGLAVMAVLRRMETEPRRGRQIAWFALGGLIAFGGELIQADYGCIGILLIAVLYLLRNYRLTACLAGYGCMLWEGWSFPAFILAYFYNGQKGKGSKYFFYFFYPLHLLLLYLFRRWM